MEKKIVLLCVPMEINCYQDEQWEQGLQSTFQKLTLISIVTFGEFEGLAPHKGGCGRERPTENLNR